MPAASYWDVEVPVLLGGRNLDIPAHRSKL